SPSYTVKVEPSYNASQELRNGVKRPVGRAESSLSIPRLQFSPSWARWYFKGDALISTDGKDKGSKVAFASGLERSLLTSWYLPGYIEGKTQGDQVRDNHSVIASVGLKTVIPWKLLSALRPALNNAVVKTPFGPDVAIALQNEWRLEQDKKAREI